MYLLNKINKLTSLSWLLISSKVVNREPLGMLMNYNLRPIGFKASMLRAVKMIQGLLPHSQPRLYPILSHFPQTLVTSGLSFLWGSWTVLARDKYTYNGVGQDLSSASGFIPQHDCVARAARCSITQALIGQYRSRSLSQEWGGNSKQLTRKLGLKLLPNMVV